MTPTLPARVPALRPEQIRRGWPPQSAAHDTCLVGWCHRIFGPSIRFINGGITNTNAYSALYHEIRARGDRGSVGSWNDAHAPAERAAMWARACERLGYVRAGDEFVLPDGDAKGATTP